MCKDCGCGPGYCACGPSGSILGRALRMRKAREARETTKDVLILTLKCENKELREDIVRLSARVNELLANQDELRHNAQSDAAHIDRLQKDNQLLREDIVRRAIELASLKQRLWDTCDQLETVTKENDEAQAAIYRMHNIIAQYRAERKHRG